MKQSLLSLKCAIAINVSVNAQIFAGPISQATVISPKSWFWMTSRCVAAWKRQLHYAGSCFFWVKAPTQFDLF